MPKRDGRAGERFGSTQPRLAMRRRPGGAGKWTATTSMGLLDRYILRSVLTPLLLSLCVAGMLLLLEQMLRLFDFVLAEQGPVDVVWRMLANLLPHYLSLALPLGAFLGIMLAFRTLSLSSELDALSSGGVSFGRLMRPVYLLVAALMAFDFMLVGYIQPYAGYQYSRIRFDVTSGALGIKIPQGEFVEISEDALIRLGSVDPLTRRAQEIFLKTEDDAGARTIITAEQGSISTSPDLTRLLLQLDRGRQLFIGPTGQRLETLDFQSFDVEIELPIIAGFRPRGEDEEEATFPELWAFLNAPNARSDPSWNSYRAAFHWRLIHPLTFLAMPILAVAMGVTGRRRASSLKPIVGVAILIVYHELLEEWGQVTAAIGDLSPYISMWGLLIAFMAISSFLYIGSIDQARTAKVMARRKTHPIRVGADGSLTDDQPATSLGSAT
ncbi:MAG: LptF/LptG family permease [Alphaproteobacteria bacterium]|nr:LptF/LptG family permease [Alphaproteobacteria bacterium]